MLGAMRNFFLPFDTINAMIEMMTTTTPCLIWRARLRKFRHGVLCSHPQLMPPLHPITLLTHLSGRCLAWSTNQFIWSEIQSILTEIYLFNALLNFLSQTLWNCSKIQLTNRFGKKLSKIGQKAQKSELQWANTTRGKILHGSLCLLSSPHRCRLKSVFDTARHHSITNLHRW